MENSIFSYALAIFLFSSITLCLGSDKHALISFKHSIIFDPRAVLSTNWSDNTPACNWVGVSCGPNHRRVTALHLSGYDLAGTVTPHLGNLTFLRYLDISSNNFTGILPSELSSLRRLKVMNVGVNSLSGDVPIWLGSLPQLEQLHLDDNTFSGTIPASLFNNSKLQILNMSFNEVGGNIPKEIGNISSLQMLYLDNNRLSGPIPQGIFNVSSMREIGMVDNNLSDGLTSDMCNNAPNLKVLLIWGNQLSGEIPRNIWKCRDLQDLELSVNHFSGKIPREIGSLSKLRMLFVGVNDFRGEIPPEIGNLSRLEILGINNANLMGNVPSSIFNMSSLKDLYLGNNSLSGWLASHDMCNSKANIRTLSLFKNELEGKIPPNIWKCRHLEMLDLNNNNLSGGIPREIGNMSMLRGLYLRNNALTGELPQEIGSLTILQYLNVYMNSLHGSISSSIFNLSTLKILDLSDNEFSGTLPSNMGRSLVNLDLLYLGKNKFDGPIPSSITNASKLTQIEMFDNSFSGPIPNFGDLRLLQILNIEENNLSGAEAPTQELMFLSSLTNCRYLKILEISYNPLKGILPTSIGNFSNSLESIRAENSNIMGVIPSEIGNLGSLLSLHLGRNKLSGLIPSSIGGLKKLQRIYISGNQLVRSIPNKLCGMMNLGELGLDGNMLVGPIPECLGDVKSLREIYLGSNHLSSIIPPNFWTLKDLTVLDLSKNNFTGQLSSQVGKLEKINFADLSFNRLSGDIPSMIDACQSLEFLNLSNNQFGGSLPNSFGNLRGLTKLDLSCNNLSGSIPKSLEGLLFLEYFNASYNKLHGRIPDRGCFSNFTAQSFAHNLALCGSTRFQVKPCSESNSRSRVKKVVRLIKFTVPSLVLVLIAAIAILFFVRRRKQEKVALRVDIAASVIEWRRFSYTEIEQATSSFSETNLLGRGSYGSVFRAILCDGLEVAVKVFNLQLQEATRSFDTETAIMSNIRHRNLVPLIGWSGYIEFKALIMSYMPNGSLDKWLYSDIYHLDLIQRLKIALNVAAALEYLHHGYIFPIVHCDIKPINVLLDEDMVAHLADFGIAKLFQGGEAVVQTQTLATIGYAAPELGMEGKVSTNGDVYSFGIMLLEMFTGMRPTDDMFGAEKSLKEWVIEAIQENAATKIVAPALLLSSEDRHLRAKEQCVSSIFELAMKCLAFSPQERINMTEANATLQKINARIVAAIQRHRPRYAFPDNIRDNGF